VLITSTSSTFTFLFQDENSGLEFGDRASGDFVPASPREGILYMNIGDMFQRISNSKWEAHKATLPVFCPKPPSSFPRFDADLFLPLLPDIYPSGLHRVSVSGLASGQPTPARYSIPYFVCPAPDGTIEPQPSLVAAVGKKHYEPITYQKFAEQMFDTTNIYD